MPFMVENSSYHEEREWHEAGWRSIREVDHARRTDEGDSGDDVSATVE